MTSRDFCYWLQGFFEMQRSVGITEPIRITEKQSETIENHLKLVFVHEIDPSIDGGDATKKAQLQAVHDGKPTVTAQPAATDPTVTGLPLGCPPKPAISGDKLLRC